MTEWIILAVTLLAGVLGWGQLQRRSGRRDAKRETALEAAERTSKLERERGERDADIQDDDDLVRRARAAGVVRDGSSE